jgi:hypothetical protein
MQNGRPSQIAGEERHKAPRTIPENTMGSRTESQRDHTQKTQVGGRSLHRLAVRTSRCGRDNPGSNPGVDIFGATQREHFPGQQGSHIFDVEIPSRGSRRSNYFQLS